MILKNYNFIKNSAKEALRKVYQERSEALQKLATLERALCSSEDECSLLRDQLLKSQQSLQEVTERLSQIETNFQSVKDKIAAEKYEEHIEMRNLGSQLSERSRECDEMKEQVDTLLKEKEELLNRVTLYQYCEVRLNFYYIIFITVLYYTHMYFLEFSKCIC